MKRTALTALALILISLQLFLTLVGTVSVNLASANPIIPPPKLVIYIDGNGNVNPSTAPIQRAGNIYNLINDTFDARIVIQCDNVVVDGRGFILQGTDIWNNDGLTLTDRRNVTVQNIDIRQFGAGIRMINSSNNIITGNRLYCAWGLMLDSSSNNQIRGNNILGVPGGFGIGIKSSSSNTIIGNNITGVFRGGISFFESFNNIVCKNYVACKDFGVSFCTGITGLHLNDSSANNIFYRNNFVNNTQNVKMIFYGSNNGKWMATGANLWDNGKQGNYWSDYDGNNSDGDGIGGEPYTINTINQDNFPLINQVPTSLPISILSPKNKTCTSGNVSLTFTISEPSSLMDFSIDGQKNVTITGNTTMTGLTSGLHNITVYAKDTFENIGASETIFFSIEEPFPTAWIAIAAVLVAFVSIGFVVYIKKVKKKE
jgi:parallel beta-helix repeat protein